MMDKPIEERVPAYELMINNAMADTQIATEISMYGYPVETMTSLKQNVSGVKNLMFIFKKEHGDQYQATLVHDELRVVAHKYYMRLLSFARILFGEDRAASAALALSGNREEDYGGWLVQVQTFYNNMLATPAYLEKMAGLNCNQALIEEGKNLLDQVVKAKENQAIERGEAQIATVNRNVKLAELDKLMSRFKKVCEVIFADQPQVLEKLGIVKS